MSNVMLYLISSFSFTKGNWQLLKLYSVVFRMEVLNCRNSSFLAKTFGTVVSISGAIIVTLYKGPEILTHLSSPKLHYEFVGVARSSWIIGGLFLAADCVVASGYIIVQV